MKHWYNLICLLFLASFVSYGQNVYQHYSELNGMEDYNGNTNLLYRIYSTQQDMYNNNTGNNIYLLNVVNKIDTVFQLDYSYYNEYTGQGYRVINGYDFWEKNPRKFIVCGGSGSVDGEPFIERFDYHDIRIPLFGGSRFIALSRQNDSLVYATFDDGLLYRSTSGGFTWDTAGNFNAVSLSPYNDKVLFTSEYNKLIKTTDGGLTKTVVDSLPLDVYRTDSFFYDKDTNYIYCTDHYYYQDKNVYNLLVSINSGYANSWQSKLTSTSPIYISLDNAVTGSLYLATDKYLYHSTDFGNSFSLYHTFDKSLVGIYKKPGSSKLYAATYTTIYELDGSAISIVKQIPIDPEIFKFDPLDIENKWYYNTNIPSKGVLFKEVIKDTVLANLKTFKQIKQQLFDSLFGYVSYSYERIDSSTGNVYGWWVDSTEYIIDNLNYNLGDTIYVSRYYRYGETIFDSLNIVNIFGKLLETRAYWSTADHLNFYNYDLTKNIGLLYLHYEFEQLYVTNNLKGAVIKGIVYGDTTTITGITDKYPAIPDKYSLSQNYPNPFNPATTINYSIQKAGQVKLTIYNAIGSKVAIILNEFKQPGNYSVKYNASNLASGIYLYRLESGNYSAVKKFILLK
ncbi:MAG: T9SS type A sorting domain-containing protein [Ignavibacteriaceae bacterium]|nr:T9SS type A sorting domain-containing protein [Ignavibacteriaceae bacterium]